MSKLIISFIAILGLTACGVRTTSTPEQTIRTFEFSTFGSLKLISPDIQDPKDKSSFEQSSFLVSEELPTRLLLKSENLKERTTDITIDEHFTMALEMHIDTADLTAEQVQGIKACPLKSNWLLLATWEKAHPFGDKGNWTQSGGDFNQEDCISVASYNGEDITIPKPKEEEEAEDKANQSPQKTAKDVLNKKIKDNIKHKDSSDSQNTAIATQTPKQDEQAQTHSTVPARIQFNITQWYLNKARTNNYGFVIVSETPIHIYGTASSFSPTIKWSQPLTIAPAKETREYFWLCGDSCDNDEEEELY